MKILLVNKYWFLKGGAERVIFDTKKLLEIVNCQNTRRYWQYEECFKK